MFIPAFIIQRILDNFKRLVPASGLRYGSPKISRLYLGVLKTYTELFLHTQYISPGDLEKLQLLRLKNALYAASKTKWWSKRFNDAGFDAEKVRSISELKALPVIEKADVVSAEFQDLSTESIKGNQRIVIRGTSGTNGMPVRWALDKPTHFIECAAYHLRNLLVFGVPIWKDLARKPIFMINHYNVEFHHLGLLARDIRLQIDHKSDNSKKFLGERTRLYQEMNSSEPFIMFGATTNLWYFIKKLIEDGCHIRPAHIISTGYVLDKGLRTFFEEFFGCRVSSFYGSQEVPAIAFRCPQEDNVFHLNAEHLILEIVDEEGQPLPIGKMGYIVLTCLSNLVMPVLRYRLGDMGRMLDGSCDCGRTLPRFELIGRDYEFIRLKDGEKIPSYLLYTIIMQDRFLKIYQYQIRQVAEDMLHIYISPNKTWSKEDELGIKMSVQKAFRGKLSAKVIIVDKIPAIGRKHKSFVPLVE